MLVLIGHFFNTHWVWEERLGVDVFFVLSGMLMSIILFEKRIALKDFYIRRFSRVYPAFCSFVFVAFSLAYITGESFSFAEIIATLTFVRTYFPADVGLWETKVAIGHLWSLNVEEHAYLIMSVFSIICVYKKPIASVMIVISLILMAVNGYVFYTDYVSVKQHLITTQAALGFIFFSAGYGLFKRERDLKVNPWFPLIALGVAFVCYVNTMPLWLTFTVCPVLLSIAINHLQESHALVVRLFQFLPLRMLGLWSYSIYLWQQIFYMYEYALPGGGITGFGLSIFVGVISFYCFENPIRSAINNTWSANPTYRTSLR